MLKYLFLYCVLIGMAMASKPLSILMIEPLPSTSHHLWTTHLAKEILRRGHHLHVLSIHETKIDGKLGQNLTYSVFDNILDTLRTTEEYNPADWVDYSVFYMTYFTYHYGIFSCEKLIETKGAKEILNIVKDIKFDVIVQDVTLNPCLYALWEVAKGKPPVVGYIPYGSVPWLKDYVGGFHYPSVRPYTHARLVNPLNLWARTWNLLYHTVDDLMRQYYFLPTVQRIAEQYVGHKIRPLNELERNISIILINSHSTFEPGIPLPPNVQEIGGIHAQIVQPTADEVPVTIPESMRKFLDGANNGAVVISLGTNVNWKGIKADKVKEVVVALSKLKQQVLWKLDANILFPIPDNIMIVKWMPQDKILTHKNVKAIWTHGGLLSTQEAIWHGVPVIGMPFFMDQTCNIDILVQKGVGIRLDFDTLSTETVLEAFEKILYNESYTKSMKRLSSEYRDRPMPPLDLAMWSIEYAVRHPHGNLASLLRSQSRIEQSMIDSYAILFLSLIIILLTLVFAFKMAFNCYINYVYTASKIHKKKES